MGLLSMLEARFGELRRSSRFEDAWREIRAKHPYVRDFQSPEALRDFCQDPEVGHDRQDPIVLALCMDN